METGEFEVLCWEFNEKPADYRSIYSGTVIKKGDVTYELSRLDNEGNAMLFDKSDPLTGIKLMGMSHSRLRELHDNRGLQRKFECDYSLQAG